MGKWEEIKSKYLGKIANIISWVISIAGLVVSIVSFIKNDTDLGWGVTLAIVIFNSIFLIIISIYETLLYKRGTTIEKEIKAEKGREIAHLNQQLFSSIDLSAKLRYYFKYIIYTLNKFSTRLLAANSKYAQAKSNIEKIVEDYGNAGSGNDEKFDVLIKSMIDSAERDYRKSMLEEFNLFLGNISSKLKEVLDASLRNKDCPLETSISIKQFSRIVIDPDDVSDVVVITTFRDSQTYSQGKREVGTEKFSINKNTDFIYCLTHPYFLKNNITLTDKTYDNEHTGFLEFYNCAIVVPIKCEYPDYSHVFGYLTCDILNPDPARENLLDEKMAEIMEATARIIGDYFDSMDFQWEYSLESDFLDIVYNMKCGNS